MASNESRPRFVGERMELQLVPAEMAYGDSQADDEVRSDPALVAFRTPLQGSELRWAGKGYLGCR